MRQLARWAWQPPTLVDLFAHALQEGCERLLAGLIAALRCATRAPAHAVIACTPGLLAVHRHRNCIWIFAAAMLVGLQMLVTHAPRVMTPTEAILSVVLLLLLGGCVQAVGG